MIIISVLLLIGQTMYYTRTCVNTLLVTRFMLGNSMNSWLTMIILIMLPASVRSSYYLMVSTVVFIVRRWIATVLIIVTSLALLMVTGISNAVSGYLVLSTLILHMSIAAESIVSISLLYMLVISVLPAAITMVLVPVLMSSTNETMLLTSGKYIIVLSLVTLVSDRYSRTVRLSLVIVYCLLYRGTFFTSSMTDRILLLSMVNSILV